MKSHPILHLLLIMLLISCNSDENDAKAYFTKYTGVNTYQIDSTKVGQNQVALFLRLSEVDKINLMRKFKIMSHSELQASLKSKIKFWPYDLLASDQQSSYAFQASNKSAYYVLVFVANNKVILCFNFGEGVFKNKL